jgi:ribosomal protein L37AE/L43A
MHPCDLCASSIIARVALLGGRSDRRIWLCVDCFHRFEDHELAPEELLALARLTARRQGKCEWCAEAEPVAQVRVPGADGKIFAFHLCAACARDARERAGGQILHGQAAIAGDVANDPRYDKAVAVARRRKALHRVK